MKSRLLVGLALLGLLGFLAIRGSGRVVAPIEKAPSRTAAPPAPSAALEPVALDQVRDPFRYADAPPAAASVRSVRIAPAPPAPPPPSEPSFRLVGVVRRDGRLCAALAIGGEVVLLAPGESAGGVTVLAVQEDGVRLRGPDGRDEVVALP